MLVRFWSKIQKVSRCLKQRLGLPFGPGCLWSAARLTLAADADARKVVFVAKGRDALTVAGFAQ
jgi:hypothetical protein